MKDRIKNAYKSVALSDTEKSRMLGSIKKHGSKKRYYWIAAAAVVAMAAVILGAFLLPGINTQDDSKTVIGKQPEATEGQDVIGALQTQEVIAARITLSINPSVEFRLDKDGLVIEVVGTNEDGILLLEGMEASGLSLENATILVVNRLIEAGYITDSSIVKEITLTIYSGEFEIDALEMMSGIIKTAAGAYDIDVDVEKADAVNGVNIVLAGKYAENPEKTQEVSPLPDGATVASVISPEEIRTILFECEGERLGNIWMGSEDDEQQDFVRFICKDLKEVVVNGLAYLIDTGFITDPYKADKAIEYELRLSDPTEQRLRELYDIADMMIKESGLMLEVTRQSYGASIYLDDMLRAPREAEYTMNEILNPVVLKERNLITQQQMQILEYVYSEEELEAFLGRPSRFKLMPVIVGLTEQKAVEIVKETGMIPEVEYFYNPLYMGGKGTVCEQYMEALDMYETGRVCTFVVQTDRPDEPCIVSKYVPVDMNVEDYETYLIDNGLVQAHWDLENIGMPPAMKEELGPVSQAEYDMYNELLRKIGIELRYLKPGERAQDFWNDEAAEQEEMSGYPTPKH